MKAILVNTNRMKPPIGPIGLEYVAEAVVSAGHDARILDLAWAEDYQSAIRDFFTRENADVVGLTLRNTDDCSSADSRSFLEEFADIVSEIRKNTDALILAGGVGFSVMPEKILEISGADVGVWGEGEFVVPQIIDRIEKNQTWRDLPNLVFYHEGAWHRNAPVFPPLSLLPPMTRRHLDNPRYFLEGGQGGIETKRGCPNKCIYCADPVAKGNHVRTRPPESVAFEIEQLLNQGIDSLHTCDSEFNIPEEHAREICREIVRRGLGDKIRWYAYCSPKPFSRDLACLMHQAGCVGINFGVDSGDRDMLKRLGRDFTPEDILETVKICHDWGIVVMLDLLIGAPGESAKSIENTVNLMRKAEPDRIGVPVGVGVYPGTPLEAMLRSDRLHKNSKLPPEDPASPCFFLEPQVSDFVFQYLDDLIGNDERFFFFDPSKPDRNYNYNANQALIDAIGKGYRGAYWDILRRVR
jgi:radical SAM superfamily enzyme YgiQ (UPF0313 family)